MNVNKENFHYYNYNLIIVLSVPAESQPIAVDSDADARAEHQSADYHPRSPCATECRSGSAGCQPGKHVERGQLKRGPVHTGEFIPLCLPEELVLQPVFQDFL